MFKNKNTQKYLSCLKNIKIIRSSSVNHQKMLLIEKNCECLSLYASTLLKREEKHLKRTK